MILPSGRLTGFLVRTTTALRTSPRLTLIALLSIANRVSADTEQLCEYETAGHHDRPLQHKPKSC